MAKVRPKIVRQANPAVFWDTAGDEFKCEHAGPSNTVFFTITDRDAEDDVFVELTMVDLAGLAGWIDAVLQLSWDENPE